MTGTQDSTRAEDVLDALRTQARGDDRPALLFRGFGPLLVVALLLVAMMLLLPSVAPERFVPKPAGGAGAGATSTEPGP